VFFGTSVPASRPWFLARQRQSLVLDVMSFVMSIDRVTGQSPISSSVILFWSWGALSKHNWKSTNDIQAIKKLSNILSVKFWSLMKCSVALKMSYVSRFYVYLFLIFQLISTNASLTASRSKKVVGYNVQLNIYICCIVVVLKFIQF
jgi:hypothetical protein